jgi:hypothetical protein
MAMNSTAWGTRVAAAVQAAGVSAGTPVTTGQLEAIWQAIKGEDVTEIKNADTITNNVQPGSGTATGTVTG